jgi:hypothetical protein
MNVERAKIMRTSKQPTAGQIMIDQEQLKNMGSFKHSDNMIASDAICTREIIFSLSWRKQH